MKRTCRRRVMSMSLTAPPGQRLKAGPRPRIDRAWAYFHVYGFKNRTFHVNVHRAIVPDDGCLLNKNFKKNISWISFFSILVGCVASSNLPTFNNFKIYMEITEFL